MRKEITMENRCPLPAASFIPPEYSNGATFPDDLWAIRVDPGGEFTYRSGQYATLGVVTPEKHHERPYSIVSAPHEKSLEFFFELVPHGQVTPRFHAFRWATRLPCEKPREGISRSTAQADAQPFSGRYGHGRRPVMSATSGRSITSGSNTKTAEPKLFVLEGASRSWELGYSEELEKLPAKFPG